MRLRVYVHIHLCIKLCPNELEELSNEQVIERWVCLFKYPMLVQKWRDGKPLHSAELQAVNNCIIQYRKRLSSLSWFIKCINKPIALLVNRADNCTGYFWGTFLLQIVGPEQNLHALHSCKTKARYTSQSSQTEEALLSCIPKAFHGIGPGLR